MLIFGLVVALLLLGALLLLLPALWNPKAVLQGHAGGANVAVYRDQLREAERDLAADVISRERYEQLRDEIDRRVLEDTQAAAAVPMLAVKPARRTALVLAVLIPAASVATYLVLGQPQTLSTQNMAAAGARGDKHELSGEEIQRMVSALAERLKAEPGNAEGWLMLGRSYTALGRYRDAATAFRKAVDLLPGNASLLADLADVLAMAQGRRLAGEPARLIQQALDADPRHVKALALAGSVAFETKDYSAARGYWERLAALVPADSEMARSVRGSIAEAAQLESGAPAAAPATVQAAAPSASSAAVAAVKLGGEVVLSAEMAARVAQGDTVFVFARAAEGPRIPLAIVKQPVGAWPLRFSLDDSLAMSPNLKLSGFAQVVVGARISKSGNATPQSGDLVGQSATVANSAQGLRIVIDRTQP